MAHMLQDEEHGIYEQTEEVILQESFTFTAPLMKVMKEVNLH